MIQPDFKTFRRLASQGNLVPVYDTFTADLLTPVGAYLRIARDARYAFLLESVEGGETVARYTFAGANPVEVFRARGRNCTLESHTPGARKTKAKRTQFEGNPIEELRRLTARFHPVRVPGLPPLIAGAIGYCAYDMVRLIEQIPATGRDDLELDDCVMMFYLGLLVFDHVRHRVWIIRNVFTEGAALQARNGKETLRAKYDAAVREIERTRRMLEGPLPPQRRAKRPARLRIRSNMTKPQFLAGVEKAKEYIRAGDIFQVVPSQRFRRPFAAPPFALYRALRRLNPSPFLYFLNFPGFSIVGSSPEILVRVANGTVTIRPIAGTRPRGKTETEDKKLASELLADPKERAEHLMLLDLGRNDVGRVAETGSVRVTAEFFIERYSHVMHIVSNVEGRLRQNLDAVDALIAGFPAGTLSGAPKVRAMEIIDELEKEKRGLYGGAVGYFAANGDLDTCIVLRTAVVKDGTMFVQAGGGVVADSDAEAEYQETVNKAKALFAAADEAMKTAE
ncbi:MAG TPA: anthranilate synthase component I [Candidatus Acidoferrum sp.]|nr:anthranilate synthase component I [Candidatus Acidoferrum sp.]